MKKKIVILGAGGFAKELIWIIKDINDKQKKEDFVYYDILGLIDEDKGKDGLMLTKIKQKKFLQFVHSEMLRDELN